MSRIQAVKQNYQQNSARFSQNKTKYNQNTSFSGLTPEDSKIIVKEVGKKIDESFAHNPVKKATNFFSKLFAKNEGEIQSQVINAVFTTTLAPLFIAFNPFSTQDKKTKEYTALRQPISAAVAITGGFALTSVTNSWVEKLGSEGHLGRFLDMRIAPDKNYLGIQFKKDLKAAKDQKAFLASLKVEDFNADDINGSWKQKRAYKKACLEAYAEQIKTKRQELFATLLTEHPDNIIIDEAAKTISVKGKTENKVIGENIPNLTTKKQLDTYLDANNFHKVKFSKILEEEFKFEFFDDGTIKPYVLEKNLGDIKAMDFLRKLGLFKKGEVDEEELNRFMADARQDKKTVKAVNRLIQPATWTNPATGAKDFTREMGKDFSSATQALMGEKNSKEEAVTLRQLFNRLELTGQKLQDLVDKDAHAVLKELSEHHLKGLRVAGSTKIEHDVETFKSIFKDKTPIDFGKNMMKNRAEKLSSYFKSFKGYTGIFFNVFIVMITCTALNWLYPRIVEKAFPSLVKDDAPKGGNK